MYVIVSFRAFLCFTWR